MVKEFRQIRRDKRSLGVLLVLPAFLVFMIGYALNFDVKHVAVAVFDQDKSSTGRGFIRGFSNSEYFRIVEYVENYREAEKLLDAGKAVVVIVLPTDFSKKLSAGTNASVQLLIDGSNANTATTVIGYCTGVIQNFSTTLAIETLSRSGREAYMPVDFRPTVWYNPELASSKFLIPGMIGFILMITGVVSTSLSVVKEKERGTLEQLLISPLRMVEIILGKTIPYLVIALFASVLVVLVGFVAFGVAVKGSLLWLYAGIILFLLCALGQGLLISAIAQTQQVAFIVSVFSSLLPTFLLSGFIFPIKSMPFVLQIISYVAPAKYFLVIARSVVLKGTGPEAYWEQFLALGIFAVVILAVSTLRLIRSTSAR